LRSLEGRAESDPRKIADVIVQLANSDEVSMRKSGCSKQKLRAPPRPTSGDI
jgi:hypothetical protein